jgi:ribosomal protein S18 acetylase RimI-like enzyme
MVERPARIRPFRPADTDACYEVCLRTADDGGDASGLHRDPRVVGEVWVGPYLVRHPELAVVACDDDGVGGYIVGAPDTIAFEEWAETTWFPPLRRRYPRACFPEGSRDAAVVSLIHGPLRMSPDVCRSHPAHLHIDLLPRFQGRGLGRRLMNALFDRLRAAGVPAVHLGCSPTNTRAITFYRRLGFQDLAGGFLWGRSTARV